MQSKYPQQCVTYSMVAIYCVKKWPNREQEIEQKPFNERIYSSINFKKK